METGEDVEMFKSEAMKENKEARVLLSISKIIPEHRRIFLHLCGSLSGYSDPVVEANTLILWVMWHSAKNSGLNV